jgi:glutamyl-tRNA reductase
VAQAAVATCRESLGDLRSRRILVLGAGQIALDTVREFQKAEAGRITVVNRSWDRAQQLAKQCRIKAAPAENLWEEVLWADAVVSAASQRVLLTRDELEVVLRERGDKPIVIVDLAVPRTVEANIRNLDGVAAYDLDDLNEAVSARESRRIALPLAERIIAEEAAGFRAKLLSESILPLISAMRERLELICKQEMEQLKEQFGPFTEDQQAALDALSSHITQRIAATVARQFKELPGCPGLTIAIQQLFQLQVNNAQASAGGRDLA